MGKINLGQKLEAAGLAAVDGGGLPLAVAVRGEDGRFLEGRGEERGGNSGVPEEANGVQVGELETLGLEAIVDGLVGKARVVLEAREALFLAGGEDPTVDHEGGGGGVGMIDAQDLHVHLDGLQR
jgi:hypothetical protein